MFAVESYMVAFDLFFGGVGVRVLGDTSQEQMRDRTGPREGPRVAELGSEAEG